MLAMCGEKYEEVVPGFEAKWLSEKEHMVRSVVRSDTSVHAFRFCSAAQDYLRCNGFLLFNQV